METTFGARWGESSPDAVTWLLGSGPARGALEAGVAGMLAEGSTLSGLRLRRAALRPGRGLRATFTATLLETATGETVSRPLSVLWRFEQREGMPATPSSGAAPSFPPFRQLAFHDPLWGMDILIWPFDPTFEHLALAADPHYARELLSRLQPPGRGHADIARVAVMPVRYVPGHSHVLRYDPVDAGRAPGPTTLFAKLYATKADCARHRETTNSAAAALEATTGRRAACPLGDTTDTGILVFPWVPGASLAALIRQGSPGVSEWLESLGGVTHALHRAPIPPGLPSRLFSTVISGTAYATLHLETLLPSALVTARALLTAVEQAGQRTPPEPPALVHGDLKLEHARVSDESGLTLIDFDTLAHGEPADDLGQLLADVRWEFLTSGSAGFAEAQQRLLDGYRASGPLPPERLRRARVYEVAFFLRSVVRQIKISKPGWASRTEELLSIALSMSEDLRSG